ncbi:MAG: hypothetical protein QOH31_6498, partial [Verrucomicrobiota bacterium]
HTSTATPKRAVLAAFRMDILGSFAFDDHTNVHLVAGAGYTARERYQLKRKSTPPGTGGQRTVSSEAAIGTPNSRSLVRSSSGTYLGG